MSSSADSTATAAAASPTDYRYVEVEGPPSDLLSLRSSGADDSRRSCICHPALRVFLALSLAAVVSCLCAFCYVVYRMKLKPNPVPNPVPTPEPVPEIFDEAAWLDKTHLGSNACVESQLKPNQGMCERCAALRIEVLEGTLKAVKDGYFYVLPKKKVQLDLARMAKGLTSEFACDDELPQAPKNGTATKAAPFGTMEVEVREMDCLVAAHELRKRFPDSHIAVLNMAYGQYGCGLQDRGFGSQSENLCRRTNLKQHTDRFDDSIEKFLGALSQEVCVFRDCEASGYRFLEEPFFVSIITLASPSALCSVGPQYTDLARRAEPEMRQKIFGLFSAAKKAGVDHLVLSAFGSGWNRMSGPHVAAIFYQYLSSSFRGAFKTVVFAILNDSQGPRNLQTYQSVFPKKDE